MEHSFTSVNNDANDLNRLSLQKSVETNLPISSQTMEKLEDRRMQVQQLPPSVQGILKQCGEHPAQAVRRHQ